MYDPILDHITNLPGEETAGASGKGGIMDKEKWAILWFAVVLYVIFVVHVIIWH